LRGSLGYSAYSAAMRRGGAAPAPAPAAPAGPRCPTRRFGATGLEMPVLSCGGMRHESAAALDALVDRAMDYGVNHFETARMYMGGRSEKDFGRTLQRYPRESFILQTKVAPKRDPKKFKAELASSMSNLKTDYLDLFAFHGVNRAAELDYVLRKGGCLEVAQQLKKQGKIRHIGFSTHAPTPVILAAIESGAFDYVNLVRPAAAAAAASPPQLPLFLFLATRSEPLLPRVRACHVVGRACSTTTLLVLTRAPGPRPPAPLAAVASTAPLFPTAVTALRSPPRVPAAWACSSSAPLTRAVGSTILPARSSTPVAQPCTRCSSPLTGSGRAARWAQAASYATLSQRSLSVRARRPILTSTLRRRRCTAGSMSSCRRSKQSSLRCDGAHSTQHAESTAYSTRHTAHSTARSIPLSLGHLQLADN
jgi:hypothetical protein